MDSIVIAGASFPCGVRELGRIVQQHGFIPQFLDHPKNCISIENEALPLRLESKLTKDLSQQNGIFLPLLESWVSEARKSTSTMQLRFDQRAAMISHSKYLLSTTLARSGIASIPRRHVKTCQEALNTAIELGYPVILRGDRGFSSRGVWIAKTPEELQECWYHQQEERCSNKFIKMHQIMNDTDDSIVLEPWISGEEWSIDCIIGPKGAQIIRVCEKATTNVAGKPVVLGYHLTDSPVLLKELDQVVPLWTQALFHAGCISFACFDIRRNSDGNLVPLDFGIRLGGNQIPLLVRRAGGEYNPYAVALASALAADPSKMNALPIGFSLIHAFVKKTGTFKGITLSRPGEIINIKPLESRVEINKPLSTFHRIGTVLTQFDTKYQFFEACENVNDWIHVDCS